MHELPSFATLFIFLTNKKKNRFWKQTNEPSWFHVQRKNLMGGKTRL
jgi:hypothetical protein